MQRGGDNSLKFTSKFAVEHGFALRKVIAMSRFLMAIERSNIDPEDG